MKDGKMKKASMGNAFTTGAILVIFLIFAASCTGPATPSSEPKPSLAGGVLTPAISPTATTPGLVPITPITATPLPTPSPIPIPTIIPTKTPAVPTPQPLPTPDWVTEVTAPVYLNPKSQHAKPGDEISVNVEVAPAGWGVSASELHLSFDASALEVVKIKAGNFLGANPMIAVEKIDNSAGSVTYVLARVGATKAPSSSGVLATVSFKLKASSKQTLKVGITSIGLSNEKFDEIKGLTTEGATIIVD